jgi:NAD(P)-dependent dehydrogenase (short-subunit alcohol dehydrogenase family)
MKVFIVGANGGIGRILSRQLAEDNDFIPVAMIRDERSSLLF